MNQRIRRYRQKHKKNKLFLFYITLFLLILSIFVSIKYSQKKKIPENDVLSLVTSSLSVTPSNKNTQNKISLNRVVQNALADTNGDYGIVIVNVNNGENYFYNDNRIFKAASLYKLWIMAVVYRQIEAGKLHENDILSQEANILNKEFNIATDSAEIKDTKITYSVDEALEKMITVSDNYAALLLTEKVRLINVASFLYNEGFLDSKVGTNGEDPTTTAHDIALFFAKIYKGKLINQEYSDKMLTLLKWQKLNSKIPKYLPENVIVAHKTGELYTFSHDAGIVYTPQSNYIITMLSESDNRTQAEEQVANISRDVYNYFAGENYN